MFNNIELMGCQIWKVPLQIQIFTTGKCNKECSWCIEKDNMHRDIICKDELLMCNLEALLKKLNKKNIPYNIVITGGEPTLVSTKVIKILDLCREVMPKPSTCMIDNRNKDIYTVGINSNGDNQDSLIFKQDRLDYIDITYIDNIRKAEVYNKNIPIRLQTVYRHSIFGDNSKKIIKFINNAIEYGYESVMFREIAEQHKDSKDILKLENEISQKESFEFVDHKKNYYDLWIKYKYKNIFVFFKKQDLPAQRLLERINYNNITSLVLWPDGRVTKSWNYNNHLYHGILITTFERNGKWIT